MDWAVEGLGGSRQQAEHLQLAIAAISAEVNSVMTPWSEHLIDGEDVPLEFCYGHQLVGLLNDILWCAIGGKKEPSSRGLDLANTAEFAAQKIWDSLVILNGTSNKTFTQASEARHG